MNVNAAANAGLKKHIGLHPKLLLCHICGREFGTKSLPLHIPKCEEKWKLQQQNLPKKLRRPVPTAPTMAKSDPNDERSIKGMTASQTLIYNIQAQQSFTEESRKECPNCSRKFLEDRLEVHLRSCTPGGYFAKKSENRPSKKVLEKGANPASIMSSNDAIDRVRMPPVVPGQQAKAKPAEAAPVQMEGRKIMYMKGLLEHAGGIMPMMPGMMPPTLPNGEESQDDSANPTPPPVPAKKIPVGAYSPFGPPPVIPRKPSNATQSFSMEESTTPLPRNTSTSSSQAENSGPPALPPKKASTDNTAEDSTSYSKRTSFSFARPAASNAEPEAATAVAQKRQSIPVPIPRPPVASNTETAKPDFIPPRPPSIPGNTSISGNTAVETSRPAPSQVSAASPASSEAIESAESAAKPKTQMFKSFMKGASAKSTDEKVKATPESTSTDQPELRPAAAQKAVPETQTSSPNKRQADLDTLQAASQVPTPSAAPVAKTAQKARPKTAKAPAAGVDGASAAASRPATAGQRTARPAAAEGGGAGQAAGTSGPQPFKAKFCCECGFKYQMATEKFCSECGTKRI